MWNYHAENRDIGVVMEQRNDVMSESGIAETLSIEIAINGVYSSGER